MRVDDVASDTISARALDEGGVERARVAGRGLHSSTFQLNLSRFGHTCPC
jgi:hypothetical protein